MSSKRPKQYLVVLDVGHGNAAVLHDAGGTVVFDTGKGAHVGRHLQSAGVRHVQAMLLSHADADHIGGAVTLLLDKALRIEEVLLNSDASKNSVVFEQLRYALAEANRDRKTKIDRRLTTSTQIDRDGARIEVLHPPDAIVLSGVLGKSNSGKQHNSNSMSAAIRVSCGPESSVMLAGDIESDCLDEWKARKVQPSACVLVFPHHGGMPGTCDKAGAALFGFEITRMVSPEIVIFSNHRTKDENPQDEIISAISKAAGGIRFACTQLPNRFHSLVGTSDLWSLHKPTSDKGVIEGSICLEFQESGVRVCFGETP